MSKTHSLPANSMTRAYTSYERFDLLDYLDNLEDDYLAARITNSLAWRWDVVMMSCVRAVFKAISEELYNTGSVETRADAINILSEIKFAEENFSEIGSAVGGMLTRFHQLNDMRSLAVELAVKRGDNGLMYRGRTMDYDDPGFVSRIHEKREAKVSATAKSNFELEATMLAKRALQRGRKVPANYAERYALDREKSALQQAQSLNDYMEKQAPALEVIYTLMTQNRPDGLPECTEFHRLDLEVQKVLLGAAMQSAERAKDDAATDNSLGASFGMILMEFYDVEDTLMGAMAAPKFAEPGEPVAMQPKLPPVINPAPIVSSATQETREQIVEDRKQKAADANAYAAGNPAPF